MAAAPNIWREQMEFEIKREDDGVDGAYFIEDGGKRIGEMTYRIRPGKILIIHTGVEKEYGRHGLGLKLVMRAVEDARKEGFKIKPYCPFAKKVIEGKPELHDVLEYAVG